MRDGGTPSAAVLPRTIVEKRDCRLASEGVPPSCMTHPYHRERQC